MPFRINKLHFWRRYRSRDLPIDILCLSNSHFCTSGISTALFPVSRICSIYSRIVWNYSMPKNFILTALNVNLLLSVILHITVPSFAQLFWTNIRLLEYLLKYIGFPIELYHFNCPYRVLYLVLGQLVALSSRGFNIFPRIKIFLLTESKNVDLTFFLALNSLHYASWH